MKKLTYIQDAFEYFWNKHYSNSVHDKQKVFNFYETYLDHTNSFGIAEDKTLREFPCKQSK